LRDDDRRLEIFVLMFFETLESVVFYTGQRAQRRDVPENDGIGASKSRLVVGQIWILQ